MFKFLSNCQTVSQSGGAILPAYRQWVGALGAPHPPQHLSCLLRLELVFLTPGFNQGLVWEFWELLGLEGMNDRWRAWGA